MRIHFHSKMPCTSWIITYFCILIDIYTIVNAFKKFQRCCGFHAVYRIIVLKLHCILCQIFSLDFFFVIKINQGNIQTKALFYTLTWLNSVDKILLIWWSLFSKSSNAQFLKMVRNLSYHGMKFQNNLTIIKYKFGNENLSHPSLDL